MVITVQTYKDINTFQVLYALALSVKYVQYFKKVQKSIIEV